MYTPPVTPWELEMPEVSDPTPSEHEPRDNRACSVVFDKRIRHGSQEQIVLSRGRELPKAGSITGVKS